MKFLGRKAQGAMEYLMTYGWAILAVMIVGTALYQMGVFRMGQNTMGQTGFGNVRPIDHSSGDSNTLYVVFMNGVGASITLNVTLADSMYNAGYIGQGDITTVNLQPDDDRVAICPKGASGYSVKLNVSYVNQATALSHTSSGRVWGPC
ncbi:MAG: hypothetical protein U9M95_06060 [Candidatus Altiarchaeota archaeon]|nr:hypothetical protein [Candidatus Altiarchaeota archaeon]